MADFESGGSVNSGIDESTNQPPLIYKAKGSEQLSMLRGWNTKVFTEAVSVDTAPLLEQ